MARSRFSKQGIHRISLTDGDWIEVKKDLNTGDTKLLESAGMKPPIMLDGKPFSAIDWGTYELERAMIFLIDWSFKDEDDKPTKPSTAALKALEPVSFEEINTAIINYVFERSKEKKAERDATLKASSSTGSQMTEQPTLPSPTGTGSDQTSQ